MKHPSELLTLGEEIEVVVLELDVEGRKLSLGHKQLTQDNPWDKYADQFALDSIHKTAITEIDGGATIKFNEDVIAFVPQRHMEKEDGSKLTKGEEAEFRDHRIQ